MGRAPGSALATIMTILFGRFLLTEGEAICSEAFSRRLFSIVTFPSRSPASCLLRGGDGWAFPWVRAASQWPAEVMALT